MRPLARLPAIPPFLLEAILKGGLVATALKNLVPVALVRYLVRARLAGWAASWLLAGLAGLAWLGGGWLVGWLQAGWLAGLAGEQPRVKRTQLDMIRMSPDVSLKPI